MLSASALMFSMITPMCCTIDLMISMITFLVTMMDDCRRGCAMARSCSRARKISKLVYLVCLMRGVLWQFDEELKLLLDELRKQSHREWNLSHLCARLDYNNYWQTLHQSVATAQQ